MIMLWLIICEMWLCSDVSSLNYLNFISLLEIPSQDIFTFYSKSKKLPNAKSDIIKPMEVKDKRLSPRPWDSVSSSQQAEPRSRNSSVSFS